VVDATTFLAQAKEGRLRGLTGKVAVLGAGNTAMDAATTALDLGAKDVSVVYRRSFAEMPAWPSERSAALEAGVHFLILTQPLGYVSDERGGLTGLRIARTELGAPDDSGRRRPAVLPGTESVLAVQLAVEALGQEASPGLRAALAPLELAAGGTLRTRPGSADTGLGDVFAGGDLVNGGTTAVQAVAEGMRAAEEIDARLRGERPT
jgi:NADPH-dependent glutamate synthase beta subunit-like oxidoreductase